MKYKKTVLLFMLILIITMSLGTFSGCKKIHTIPEGIYNATEGSNFRYSEKGAKNEHFLKVKGNYVTEFLSGLGTKMKIIIKEGKIYFQEERNDNLIYHEVSYDENEKIIIVDWNY